MVMKARFSHDEIAFLMQSSNYREFITNFVSMKSARGRKYTFSALAMHSGLASRSFLLDVTKKRKRLTLKSLNQLIQGMNLTSELKLFFRKLVELEHEDCRLTKTTTSSIQRQIENVKNRLSSQNASAHPENLDLYKITNIPLIYAALGNSITGSSISEVCAKTDLSTQQVKSAIHEMCKKGITKQIEERFFVTSTHINLQNLGENQSFQNFFIESIENAKEVAQASFNSKEKLFFNASVSINKQDLAEIKKDLREHILQFLDGVENPEGDKVVTINLTLT